MKSEVPKAPLEGEIYEVGGKKYVNMGGGLLAEIAYFQKNEKGEDVPVLKTQTIFKNNGFDAEGYPKRSVEIKVRCLTIDLGTGKNG